MLPSTGEESAAIPLLLVGICSITVQLSFRGLYISLLLRLTFGEPLSICLPPTAYNLPSTTADVRCSLAVGIGAFSVQVFVFGSYARLSLDAPETSTPPTAYNVPFMKLAVNAPRAAGRAAPSVQSFVLTL